MIRALKNTITILEFCPGDQSADGSAVAFSLAGELKVRSTVIQRQCVVALGIMQPQQRGICPLAEN